MLSDVNIVQFSSRSEILQKLSTLFLCIFNYIFIILHLHSFEDSKKKINWSSIHKGAIGLTSCLQQ